MVDLFAGLLVSDHGRARAWYERFFGSPPSFSPHDTESVWELNEHGFAYILEDPERAGQSAITLFADDLEAMVDGLAGRGIEPAKRETYSNGVRKVTYRDADGNEIGLGGPPVD